MHPLLFALGGFIVETATECTGNDCPQAIQSTSSSPRKDDCKPSIAVTITSEASTTVLTTNTVTTRTTTGTIAVSPEALKRWLQQYEVVDIMMGRAVDSTIPTRTPVAFQAIQAPTLITSTGVLSTHLITNHSDSAISINLTSSQLDNKTSRNLSETASSSEKYNLKNPEVTKQGPSAEKGIGLGTTSGLGIPMAIGSMEVYSSNTTNPGWAPIITSTALPPSHTNSIKPFFSSPGSQASNTTTSSIAAALDTTNSLPSHSNMTITRASANNATAAPFTNITSAPPLPTILNAAATLVPFANATKVAPPPTTTNKLKAPFPNSTPRTTTSSNNTTSTSATTPDLPCDDAATTSPPSPYSGDAVIFAASSYSRFSIAGGGHLCTAEAETRVAIVQNGTASGSGSGVWFVEPGVLGAVLGRNGYAALRCSAGGSSRLECEEGDKRFWVGCGLGLDIAREGEGGTVVVVDGWNCTGIALSTVYL
ncbi:hypothetical protein F5X96DRAFT_690490 [Biscogniauxia mediterranea]|nr:hypothetical protein F5X96DRAFT_690490 [Biscogniauxia mediterranea]